MRLDWPVRLATPANGGEIIVTNGLSVRQAHGGGWSFHHEKDNRLCLSFSCVQHDGVILEALAVFVFTLLCSLLQLDTSRWDQK